MARQTATVTIEGGRDAGKEFVITEMSAWQAEEWMMRALSAMARAGVEVPEGISELGIPGIAVIGVSGLLKAPFEETRPLFDEMFACVQIKEPLVTRALTGDDIEDVSTRIKLRDEVIRLHTGFSLASVLSQALAQLLAAASAPSDTQTSQLELDLSSQKDSPA